MSRPAQTAAGQPNAAPERSGTLIEPGANLSAPQPGRPQPVERSGTLIETDDDIRQAFLSGHKGRQPGPPVAVDPPAPIPPAPQPAAARSAVPFRPTVRPPVAVLTVFDDGKTDGEMIRIRDHRFIIGRTEGDLCIPLDGRISARHVEITHQVVGGLHRWVVTDLQSTHGMFVRVSRTVLADKAEFLVGNGRYRFDAPRPMPGRRSTSRRTKAASAKLTAGRGRQPIPAAGRHRADRLGDRQPDAARSRTNTGSARTRRARSAGRTTRSASRGTSGCTAAARAGAGTPSTTRRPTGSGCGCPRSPSNRRPSSRSASNDFSSG